MKMSNSIKARIDLGSALGMTLAIGNTVREALAKPSVDPEKARESRNEVFSILLELSKDITNLLEPHRIPD